MDTRHVFWRWLRQWSMSGKCRRHAGWQVQSMGVSGLMMCIQQPLYLLQSQNSAAGCGEKVLASSAQLAQSLQVSVEALASCAWSTSWAPWKQPQPDCIALRLQVAALVTSQCPCLLELQLLHHCGLKATASLTPCVAPCDPKAGGCIHSTCAVC